MTYLIIGILLLMIVISYFVKDIKKFLKLLSIITISSGYITIFIGYLGKILIDKEVSFINSSKITYVILTKFNERGLILILIGALELITYIFLKLPYYKKISN